jgi:hypothetical protein
MHRFLLGNGMSGLGTDLKRGAMARATLWRQNQPSRTGGREWGESGSSKMNLALRIDSYVRVDVADKFAGRVGSRCFGNPSS